LVRHLGTGIVDTLSIPAASALANGKNFVIGFARAGQVWRTITYSARSFGLSFV
jgi:hypothetical protein